MDWTVKDLARISVGETTSWLKPVERDERPADEARLLQMGAFRGNRVDLSAAARVRGITERRLERQRLHKGDVIFKSRIATVSAMVVDEEPKEPTIISSALLRGRLVSDRITPHYLAWWVSSSVAKKYLRKVAAGTHLRILNKRTLEAMPILVPSSSRQRQITELATLAEEERNLEQALLQKMISEKKRYIQSVLLRLASDAETFHTEPNLGERHHD